MNISVFYRLAVTFLLLFSHVAYGLNVEVSVDRNPVIVNESFNLTVTADEDLPRWAFSSRPLMQEFVVGATSIDTSSVTSQGVTKRTTRWTVRLTARSPGNYTIPSFDVEGFQTQSLEIEVIEAQRSQNGENRPFFIEAEVSHENPYVQQQVQYTVDLFIHTDIPLENGTIAPPLANHAEVEQVTQNRERQEIINGQRYQVITQVYAITPQRSGSIEIQGAQFEGIYRQSNSRGFSGFARPEQVSLMTPNRTITVRPIPSGFNGPWFISEQVAIERSISPASGMVAVGEPVTETITVTAAGVRPEQIPELNIEAPDGMRVYSETPQQEVFARRDSRIGQVTYNTVYIPTAEGQYELPEVSLNWFNPTREQSNTVLAEPVQLTITPALNTNSSSSPITEPEISSAIEAENTQNTETTLTNGAPTEVLPQNDRIKVSHIIIGVLVSLWLLTLALLAYVLKRRKHSTEQNTAQHYVPTHARDALNALKRACNANDGAAIMTNLKAWQAARGAGIGSVGSLFANHSTFLAELDALETCLYSKDKPDYKRGKDFWKAFSGAHKRTHQQDPLKLYP